MSEECAISSCKRLSCALCHCCQKNICLPHLKEHQDLLISGLDPLVDQINTLGDRLKAVNIESKIAYAQQKLEEWRAECYQKIDRLFERKCRELYEQVTEKIVRKREEISRIQSKMAELIHEQQTTRRDLDFLTSTIDDLKREVDKIEQSSFNIRSQPLAINDNMVTIEELGMHRLDLSNLQSIYKAIKRSGTMALVIATNDHALLMHQEPNLCLVDRTLTVVKQGLWNNAPMYDMCWSSVLGQFIVISSDNVFLVDESKISIEKTSIVHEEKWYSCTCSDKSLYLSTNRPGSSIREYNLLPSLQLTKHWKSPDTCQKDEFISHIRYNNETLLFLIMTKRTKITHVELRTSKTLQRLWLARWNTEQVYEIPPFCCSINEDEWLVATSNTPHFIHITGDGKIKAVCGYNSEPACPCIFGPDILAVANEKGINFHKF